MHKCQVKSIKTNFSVQTLKIIRSIFLYLYERAALQLTRPYNTCLWVAGPLCGTMPQAGFDPPSAEVQTSTECEFEFDAFTLQATTAGHYYSQ